MKYIVWIVVILAIAGGGYYYWRQQLIESDPGYDGDIEMPVKQEQKQPQTTSPGAPTSPGEGENPAPTILEISMTSGYAFFTPKEITLKKGRPVKITIQNSGRHTFMIDELGVNKTLAEGANVVEFTPETEGVFIYYCATPGHRSAGQYGTVTVEE